MAMSSRFPICWVVPSLLPERTQGFAVSLFFLGLVSLASGASIQFNIASGPCIQGENVFNPCDNSDIGGMCASAPNVDKEWCCEPKVAVCGSWAETCTGRQGLAGPGQIFCQTPDASVRWCCNAEYDVCVDGPNTFNLCRTKFANPYNNTSKEEALRLKSAFFSTSTTSSEESTSTSSKRSSSTTSSEQPSTTSAEQSSATFAGESSSSSTLESSSTLPPVGGNTSESNADRETKGDTGLSVGAKAGIAVGAVAVIALLGVLVFFLMRQRRKGRQLQNQLNSLQSVPEMQGNASPWQEQAKYSMVENHQLVHEMGSSTRPTELPAETDSMVDHRFRQ